MQAVKLVADVCLPMGHTKHAVLNVPFTIMTVVAERQGGGQLLGAVQRRLVTGRGGLSKNAACKFSTHRLIKQRKAVMWGG